VLSKARRFRRITSANSDAAARAYADATIDEAYRAVQELALFVITTFKRKPVG